MEFLGTKGKWHACCLGSEPHYVFAQQNEITICKPYKEQEMRDDLSIVEFRANALLISKAPDLLGMLSQIVKDFETDYVLDGEIVDTPYEWLQDRYKEAKQLIKEATEL